MELPKNVPIHRWWAVAAIVCLLLGVAVVGRTVQVRATSSSLRVVPPTSCPASDPGFGGEQGCCQGTLSGRSWVPEYPADNNLNDLVDPFRSEVKAFLGAIAAGQGVFNPKYHPNPYPGVTVTYRSPAKAFLMYWAWQIANGGDPVAIAESVPDYPGATAAQRAIPAFANSGPDNFQICWVHYDNQGNPDDTATRRAAEDMIGHSGWNVVSPPANPTSSRASEHTLGTAIDMTITWKQSFTMDEVANPGPGPESVTITGPDTSYTSEDLWVVGATYGVIKYQADGPHWSIDGH